MAIDELNAKGVTINGQKVTLQLISEDDGADPKQGTAVAQKLVDAHVNGVVGHLNSGTTVPASKIYNDAGIVQISPATTAPAYTRQRFPGAFRTVASDAKLGSTLSKYAIETLKVKNIAVIDDRTTYGQGVADEFVKGTKKPGIKVVGREFTSANATDYTAILTSIKAKKPDLVFFGGMDSVAGPMLKQMKALGIPAVFMGGDGMCTDALGRLAGDGRRWQGVLRGSRRRQGAAGKRHGRLPRALQEEVQHGRAAVCALCVRLGDGDGDGDAGCEVGGSGQVPAGTEGDQVRGRDGDHPVRPVRRYQGWGADLVHLQGREAQQDRCDPLKAPM
jgi:hypothetical protein